MTGFQVQEEGGEKEYQADLVIDATGIDAVLRRQLIPEAIGKKTDLPQFSSFKSVRRFKGTITPGETHFPFRYMGHLDLEGVRGYTWMSKLGEDVVDLGCCIEVFEPDGRGTDPDRGSRGHALWKSSGNASGKRVRSAGRQCGHDGSERTRYYRWYSCCCRACSDTLKTGKLLWFFRGSL